jgi:hypothetical protein
VAKAQFHKHQKVWVEAVGAWASIEKIIPIWAKGFDEPVRITYDVGLGREFHAHELRGEDAIEEAPADDQIGGEWRLMRARNKWQPPENCAHHPYPGTFPVVVTDKSDWGGWRVPGAEYDRDPFKIELQARLLAASPKLMRIARELAEFVDETGGEAPDEVVRLGRAASAVLRSLAEAPQAPDPEQTGRDEQAA